MFIMSPSPPSPPVCSDSAGLASSASFRHVDGPHPTPCSVSARGSLQETRDRNRTLKHEQRSAAAPNTNTFSPDDLMEYSQARAGLCRTNRANAETADSRHMRQSLAILRDMRYAMKPTSTDAEAGSGLEWTARGGSEPMMRNSPAEGRPNCANSRSAGTRCSTVARSSHPVFALPKSAPPCNLRVSLPSPGSSGRGGITPLLAPRG